MKKISSHAPWRIWTLSLLALGFAAFALTLLIQNNQRLANEMENLREGVALNEKNTVITYPIPGSVTVITSIDQLRIEGVTTPNAEVWGYVNSADNEVLGSNTFATAGATRADASGAFSLDAFAICSSPARIIVAGIPQDEVRKEVWDVADVSDPIEFTYTGPLSGWCTQ